MNLSLQDKMVVVAGASEGVGYATTGASLKEDAKVAVYSRHEDELKGAAQALSGSREVCYKASGVSSAAEDYAFAGHAHDHFGSLDVWMNSAGTTDYRKGEEYGGEEIDFMAEAYFKSVIYGCQAASRYMKEQRKGTIVNVSSLTTRCPFAGRSTLYGPLKSAVNNLTNTFAGGYCMHNVRVTCIMPGLTVTPLIKKAISQEELGHSASSILLHRIAEPEEITKPIISPASDAASYMIAVTIEMSGGGSVTLNPTYTYDRLETK